MYRIFRHGPGKNPDPQPVKAFVSNIVPGNTACIKILFRYTVFPKADTTGKTCDTGSFAESETEWQIDRLPLPHRQGFPPYVRDDWKT